MLALLFVDGENNLKVFALKIEKILVSNNNRASLIKTKIYARSGIEKAGTQQYV